MEKSIKEIAEIYNVTTMAVRYWIKKYEIETWYTREIGKRPFLVLRTKDIEDALKIKS